MTHPPREIATVALNLDRLMRRIHGELHPKAEDFDTNKLGPLGGMLLLTIGDSEPVDAQTVSQQLGRDKSQLSKLIKRLETQGLIGREKSSSDGRAIMLTLTDAGREQLKSIQDALTSAVEHVLEPLSAPEKERLGALLAKAAPPPKP